MSNPPTKTALITGASGGIGYHLAEEFAARKHDLILTARSEAKLNELAARLEKVHKINVRVIAADLAAPGGAEELFNACKDERVEYLINNAGFGDFAFFQAAERRKIESMMQLNMRALTQLSRLFLPGMLERKHGGILNVASTAAFVPGPYMAVYHATKAYVLSFTEGVANELNGTGVWASALCPGPTKSGFQSGANLGDSGMVKNKKLPSSKEVAVYGYKAFMNKKVVAIHGFGNKFLMLSIRFTPRWIVRAIIRRMYKPK